MHARCNGMMLVLTRVLPASLSTHLHVHVQTVGFSKRVGPPAPVAFHVAPQQLQESPRAVKQSDTSASEEAAAAAAQLDLDRLNLLKLQEAFVQQEVKMQELQKKLALDMAELTHMQQLHQLQASALQQAAATSSVSAGVQRALFPEAAAAAASVNATTTDAQAASNSDAAALALSAGSAAMDMAQ